MNVSPGHADPHNRIVAFGDFDKLHFARLCLIEDRTVGDVAAYGLHPPEYPTYLAFLGDVDESAEAFLDELVRRAAPGLNDVFAHCEGFERGDDLAAWIENHSVNASAVYVNCKGRTMLQIREEAALWAAMQTFLNGNEDIAQSADPGALHAALRHFLSAEIAAARLTMTPEPPTQFSWWIRDLFATIATPVLLIVLSPLVLIAGAILLAVIRGHEATDPEICPRVDVSTLEPIAETEDLDVTNVFSAVGSLKPGLARRMVGIFGLWVLNYACQHIYTTGRLARVRTIHFARWAWIDGKRRLAFMSNYDGSLESYMDDFINKAGFGLNFVFSNGIGYPKTSWLFARGCKDEQKFKNFLHRHELPTQVWYNAHPGMTAVDLDRNAQIRAGLEARALTSVQAREWAALL